MPDPLTTFVHNTLPKKFTGKRRPVRFVPDIVFEILSHVYDANALLSCAMTCRLWREAILPHLHHSLTTTTGEGGPRRWPRPLLELHKLPGSLRFVQRLGTLAWYPDSESTSGNKHNRRRFSARTREPLGAQDRPSPVIKFHAKHRTILWSLRTIPSNIPYSRWTQSLFRANPVFFRTLRASPGSKAPVFRSHQRR